MNPWPARPVSPVAVSAVRKGRGSDEETGVRRTDAGSGRPRLHADGARVRQARGGGPPGARPLAPDTKRGVAAPQVAAVVSAGPRCELIARSWLTSEFTPGQGQLTRSANCPVPGNPGPQVAEPGTPSTWQIKINPPRRLRSPYGAYSWPGSGPICAMFARAFRKPPIGPRRTIVTRYLPIVSWILPAIVWGDLRRPRAARAEPVLAAPQLPARKQGFAGPEAGIRRPEAGIRRPASFAADRHTSSRPAREP